MNMSFKKNKLSLLIFSTSALYLSQAMADAYHYRNILVGDRAAGFAGAYTALSNDATGWYYNPAGVATTKEASLSASVNAYQVKVTEYGDLNSYTSQTWKRTSKGMVANYFGVTKPMWNGVVGFSIAIPNYELEDQSDAFYNYPSSGATLTDVNNNDYTLNQIKTLLIDYNNEDTTTLVGISYARKLAPSLSWGVTLYGYMRKQELTNWQYISATATDNTNASLEFENELYQKIQTEEFGLQPRFGLLYTPDDTLRIGLMIQTTSILSQTPEARTYVKNWIYDGTNYTAVNTTGTNLGIIPPELNATENNDLPVETNLGIAKRLTPSTLISADFSYASATSRYEATWNASIGTEYHLNPYWILRGGFYTNNANTPAEKVQGMEEHVDIYGAAFSITRQGEAGNITAGVNLYHGSGYADLNNSTPAVQSVTITGANFFITTSASF